jgi:hypothetical protein
MSLLDQFRRPDRGNEKPGGEQKRTKKPFDDAYIPAATGTAVAEENLPNHASEGDA